MLPGHDLAWDSKAPLKCKLFIWLACRERCWTADKLAKRGMEHPVACPLCDQLPENINHLLLGCVFSREVWYNFFRHWGKENWTPNAESSLPEWWSSISSDGRTKKDLATVITLVCWMLWKHRNGVVFDKKSPSLARVKAEMAEESLNWSQAKLFSGNNAFFS